MTAAQDEQIAIAHLSGASLQALADAYGYSYAGLTAKLASATFKPHLERARIFVTRGHLVASAMLHARAPEVMQRQLDLATSDDPEIALKAGQFLLGKLLPQVEVRRHEGNVGVQVSTPSPVLARFTEGAELIRSHLAALVGDVRNSPHILEGELARPKVIELKPTPETVQS